MKQFVTAILVAAGSSTRMGGGKNKQLLPLCGKPVIAGTMEAFEKADAVDAIVLVCRQEDRDTFQKIADRYGIHKLLAIAAGGKTRQQSVFSGVLACPPQTNYYAIHDGARALITPEMIEAVVEDALCYGASSAAVPVKDTLKVADPSGFVKETPDRTFLWSVQTPQIVEGTLYRRAMEKALEEQADYTDDCQLVEHLGAKVHLCMGSYENIKITTREDMALAEHFLKLREETR